MKPQNKDSIPESEEERLRSKCKDLRKRVFEMEESNEIATIALSRTQASIRRLRLEYSILLERLEDRAHQLPEGIINFEEMAGPPNPIVLDDSLVKTKNGSKKAAAKRVIKSQDAKSLTSNAANITNLNLVGSDLSKTHKYRDPDLPKRPTNAYLIFCEQEKERMKNDPELTVNLQPGDISKNMTESWKNLTDDDKKPYFKLYEDDKIRYQKEMAEYNSKKHGNEEGEEKKDIKKQKIKNENENEAVKQEVDVTIPDHPIE